MGIMGSKFLPKPEDRASRRIPQGVQRKELEHHSATSAEMPAQTFPERAAERGSPRRPPDEAQLRAAGSGVPVGSRPARPSPSCGGSIVMFGSSRSSQPGMYQAFSPMRVRK